MKKTLVAAATLLTAAGAVQAQSSVAIYGITDLGFAYSNNNAAATPANPRGTGSRMGIDSGLLQSSRFGFRGTEDLGGGLRAQFVLEGGLALDNGSFTQGGLPFGRRSTVGLNGAWGDLQLGRRKDFTDEVSGPFSSIAPFGTFITRVHSNNLDRIGGNRANNMIYYSTPRFGGKFRANVTYGFGETAGNTSAGQSFGFGALYDDNTFGVGFGYWQSKLGVVTTTANSNSDQGATAGAGCNTVGLGQPGDTCIKTWMLGARYKTGPFQFRGTVSHIDQPLIRAAGAAAPDFTTNFTRRVGFDAFTAGGANNDETHIVDVGVDYFTGPWKLKASLIQSRYDFVGAASRGKLTQYTVGAEYYLSKRTTLYGTAAHMKADAMYSPGIIGGAPGANNSQTAVGLGIRHTF